MICIRCLHRSAAAAAAAEFPPFYPPLPLPLRRLLPHQLVLFRPSRPRYLNTSTPRRITETPPATAAASTSPFSTPFTTRPGSNPPDAKSHPPRSKVSAGTPLKGLGYIKGQDAPLARPDEEYPEWLWGLLDGGAEGGMNKGGEGGDGDMFSKSKKQRRVAAKLARKAALDDPSSLIPKVPLQHQSIDLAHGEGIGNEGQEGRKAREGLTKTLRVVRRKGIKEQNFLTGMR